MYKKKACIESLASQENLEASPSKAAKFDKDPSDSPTTIVASDGEDTLPELSTPSERQEDAHSPQSLFLPTVSVTGAVDHNKRVSYVNDAILSSDVQTQLHKSYSEASDHFDDATGVRLSHFPFRHCILPNFITNHNYVDDLESALLDLPLRDKNNDLYKFSQSRDLNYSKSSMISSFKSMCEIVRGFLTTITDIPLNSKIDLFCSQYKYTDVLLCHDDELEERRIAFIYYLVPELCKDLCKPILVIRWCQLRKGEGEIHGTLAIRKGCLCIEQVKKVKQQEDGESLG
ncbi:2-oxoglutarate and iron-dependent oxygenase domain-containing 1 [Plakobranchus ocellatus]|uniref:2-oxoglutarate and iron-dependent oxygenase domain-containing 1 n=1 Tax=Plakobranchus ocellatus TaxID=259542 RepID=A0AAV4D9F0_9GAST|nr:2-oxoglutarate and iron-dependent oxygenase domain-containing 1 [Plakobranchus ocellatus]